MQNYEIGMHFPHFLLFFVPEVCEMTDEQHCGFNAFAHTQVAVCNIVSMYL